MPIVSVIIPVYNTEKYLRECIDSVLAQTFDDFELLLINDGSTDSSGEICDEYAKKDRRIKVFHQENKGPANARNIGILKANGSYITFVDADDYLKKDYYKKMITISEIHYPDIIISDIKTAGKSIQIIKNNLPKNKLIKGDAIKNNVLKYYYEDNNLGNISSLVNKFYKNSFIKSNSILIDETRIRAEDYWFNFYAFKCAETCFAIDYVGYTYNTFVENSVMKSFREDQYKNFLKSRIQLINENKVLNFKIDNNKWDTNFINNTNEFILMCIKNKRYDIVNEILGDNEFNLAIRNYLPINLHTKIIKKAQLLHLRFVSKLVYKVWSIKLN